MRFLVLSLLCVLFVGSQAIASQCEGDLHPLEQVAIEVSKAWRESLAGKTQFSLTVGNISGRRGSSQTLLMRFLENSIKEFAKVRENYHIPLLSSFHETNMSEAALYRTNSDRISRSVFGRWGETKARQNANVTREGVQKLAEALGGDLRSLILVRTHEVAPDRTDGPYSGYILLNPETQDFFLIQAQRITVFAPDSPPAI